MYCSLIGVFYSEHFLEVTAQQLESFVAGSMDCVTVNIMLNLVHGRRTVVLQFECSVLQ